jgi:hypothetical protein
MQSNYGFVGAAVSENGIVGSSRAEHPLPKQCIFSKPYILKRLELHSEVCEHTGIEVVTVFDMDFARGGKRLLPGVYFGPG